MQGQATQQSEVSGLGHMCFIRFQPLETVAIYNNYPIAEPINTGLYDIFYGIIWKEEIFRL